MVKCYCIKGSLPKKKRLNLGISPNLTDPPPLPNLGILNCSPCKNKKKYFMCLFCVSGHSEYFLKHLLRGWEPGGPPADPPLFGPIPNFNHFF